jgi:hypothetical protein
MAHVVIRTEPYGQPRKRHGFPFWQTSAQTVSPSKIPSRASWPDPVVAGPITPTAPIPSRAHWFAPTIASLQTIAPSKIPSRAHWFSPVVAGPILATKIQSRKNWFNPVVAGPLTPSIIPSRAHWFSPVVTVEQTITPPGPIPSRANWPTSAKVSNVITIRPSIIPSRASWATPAVFGSPQYIIPIRGIPSRASWPQDAVVSGGALTGIQVFLGGVEVTANYLEIVSNAPSVEPALGQGGVPQSCVVQSQTIGRWQATFKLFDNLGVISPSLAQTVIILDYGIKIFGGCIQSVVINRELSTASAITYEVTATDKSGICDRRVVAGTPSYPAGSDVATVILAIVNQYLNGEGITTNHVPTDGSLGVLDVSETFNFNTVTQAFDQIATDAGLLWFIDTNGDLHFNTEAQFPPAPFSLTETSGNWRDLTVNLNLLNYRNKQYVVSNLSTLPGSASGGSNTGGQGGGSSTSVVQETYTWGFSSMSPPTPNPGCVLQYINGIPVIVGIQVQLPIDTIQSITIQGISQVQTVYEYSNFDGSQQSQGPDDHLWVYLSANDPNGLNTLADEQTFPEILLSSGQIVTVNYVPAAPNAAASTGSPIVATTPPGAPSVGGLGTCGSGIYESVAQVQNVSTNDGLQAIAVAILSRYGGVPTTIAFQTDYPGLRPGQLLTVNIPGTYQPTAQFLITQIQGTHWSGNIGAGMSKCAVNSSFRWDVLASSILDPGNWIKWYEELIERTQNALPVYQYDVASFAIALGGGNLNGLVSTNPAIVNRTGLLFDMHAAAQIPPVGQDLIITFNVNGIPVPGSVIIPGGSAPNTDNQYLFSPTTPYYVFAEPGGENDVITVSAEYRITGANPTPAANVTASIRWRI